MAEDDRNIHTGAPVRDVLVDAVRGRCTARVIAVHVPVKVYKALFIRLGGQRGHKALDITGADRVGAAAGEAEQIGAPAGLLFNKIVHSVKVLPVGFRARVYLGIIMGVSMDGHRVARLCLFGDQILVFRELVGDKESGFGVLMFGEDIQQLLGIGTGTVVKCQIDDSAAVLQYLLFLRDLLFGDLHLAGGLGLISPFIRNGIGQRISPFFGGVDFSFDLDFVRYIAVRVIFRRIGIFPGITDGKADLFAAFQGNDRRVAVIIYDRTLGPAFVAGFIFYSIINDAVFFIAVDFVGQVSVNIVDRLIAFLLVSVVGQGISVGISGQGNLRRGRIGYCDGPVGGSVHPQEIRIVADLVGARRICIDSSRYGDRPAQLYARKDGAGHEGFSPFFGIFLSALVFNMNLIVSVGRYFDIPVIDREEKEQQGGQNDKDDQDPPGEPSFCFLVQILESFLNKQVIMFIL